MTYWIGKFVTYQTSLAFPLRWQLPAGRWYSLLFFQRRLFPLLPPQTCGGLALAQHL